ncbi:Protein Hikeshi [Frankliniella fusca]|uniref:Protein Hikeshi n=1 Tax=Frankliniella fusca TaxID=407009 RepID=A0AAE1LBN3_9NEOP|nr:Protein Hikeshi [Frankliniella fusca]
MTEIPAMFGLIVSGRIVQTDFQPLTPTNLVSTIPDAENINHVVVFLTGLTPFPPDMGGLVFFGWPDETTGSSNWQLLGFISNEKPSAIFKVSNLKKTSSLGAGCQNPFALHVSKNAQIGISVEPLTSVQQQVSQIPSSPDGSTASNFRDFCTKMLENFMNYASSFSQAQSQMVPNPSEQYVPLSTLQSWYNNFNRRLEQNPYFWRT